MMTEHPNDPRPTPLEEAESEELEISGQGEVERDRRERIARAEEDDPREEEGWTQPESSAQKGAVRDEAEG